MHGSAELAGSRARLIAAAGERRRQIQGDLHDGCLPRSRTCEIPASWGAVATSTDQVRSEVKRLAGVLLDDVERIAECSVARMQELLPSCAKVPAEKLIPVTLTNTRNLLEAVRDPDADPIRPEDHFRVSGETRVSQGIAADEMLHAWRIGLEVVREEAHPVARQLGIADDALLDFVEATLQWGDVGMRKSASAYREMEIRVVERLAAEKDALRRVATLVARGTLALELFAAVVDEVGELFRSSRRACAATSRMVSSLSSPAGAKESSPFMSWRPARRGSPKGSWPRIIASPEAGGDRRERACVFERR